MVRKIFSDDPKAPLNLPVAAAACEAIAALAKGESNAETLGDLGALKYLQALFTCADAVCAQKALAAAAALVQCTSTNCLVFLQNDESKTLADFLGAADAATQENAAVIYWAFGKDHKTREVRLFLPCVLL